MGFFDLIKSIVTKPDWDYKERRGKMRAKCRIDASLLVGSGLIGVEIRDISVKGMQLMCLGKVKPGAQVELRGVKQYNQATVHSLHCRVEWAHKQTPGWLAGVSFLDTAEDMSNSWLFWELKTSGVRMRGKDQKRSTFRVKCLIPGRVNSRTQNLQTRITDMGPNGAMIQTMGEMMDEGESVILRFGPIETLPQMSVKAVIASVHVKGAPTYGLKFLGYQTGDEEALKKYLDFFFKNTKQK